MSNLFYSVLFKYETPGHKRSAESSSISNPDGTTASRRASINLWSAPGGQIPPFGLFFAYSSPPTPTSDEPSAARTNWSNLLHSCLVNFHILRLGTTCDRRYTHMRLGMITKQFAVLVRLVKNLHTRQFDYDGFYSSKKLAHFCSNYLVDFSPYLLHRFTASLAPKLVRHVLHV
jgi:hypothetical protein